MLSTEIAPPPGAAAVTVLRARVRAARHRAGVALAAALLLAPAAQLLAEGAAGAWAAPAALLALASFAGALAALAVTQAVWGLRARAARRRERELYATPAADPLRPARRLGLACGWAVVLLLGGTVPPLFGESGFAAGLRSAMAALGWAAAGAGAGFAGWWAGDVTVTVARAVRFGVRPGDPWDPNPRRPLAAPADLLLGPRAQRWRAVPRRTGIVLAVGGVLGARGRVWELGLAALCALVAVGLACAVVTDE
ncbi:hypothetical protein ACQEUU_27620 [Nonomuraea sp. CA-218870]|uniref:hypothetical protein n=1 Tax=Nonomuraea sp. CA-218870 TaxID=3239998 RepID=UPI003D89BA96